MVQNSLFFKILDMSDIPNECGIFFKLLSEYVSHYYDFCSECYLFICIHPHFKDSLLKFFSDYNIIYEEYTLIPC